MFNLKSARFPEIYRDVINSKKFREGATFGELQNEIDEEYTRKIDAYRLNKDGYFYGDQAGADAEDAKLNEFFDRKMQR